MPQRLLLVDDEPLNLALLEAYLIPLGYQTLRARSGREAIEIFEREGADLVLLDVVLPDLDGIDVLTHIRALAHEQHVPVILVTGQTDRESRLRGLEAGADEFLEKPVDRAILLARVQTLLRLKSTTDELLVRNRELEKLHRDQREFVEFLVHDFKNPISVVSANLQWGQDHLRPEQTDITDALQDAREALHRLQRMVEDLLTVARLEEAKLPLKREWVMVTDLLDDVIRAHAREAEAKNISLSLCVDEEVGMRGDPAILRRIVENIVENSLKHTPSSGRVELTARSNSGIEISISNTGFPIAPEDRDRIFEKFTAGGGDALRASGLGLYFCKRAVEAYEGHIELTHTAEWPTSFVVHLPAA